MLLGHKQAVDLATRWKQVQADWRDAHLPPAFVYLKAVVRNMSVRRRFQGRSFEIRIENELIVTCLTPKQ
jgi:hypothetical protein